MIKNRYGKMFSLVMGAVMVLSLMAIPIITNAKTNELKPRVSNHTFDIKESNVSYLVSGLDGITPVLQVDWKVDETGQTIFCLDFSKAAPGGVEFHPGEELDKKFTYLINAFYNGNANLTGDERVDMYIIQAAIHAYDDPNFDSLTHTDGTPYQDPNNIKGRIMALRAEAEQAPETPTPEFNNSLAIKQESNKFHFVNGYYETDLMDVNSEGTGTLNASITNGTPSTQLVNENNEPISTVVNGSKIKLIVPMEEVAKNSKVGVSVKGTFENNYKAAFRYIEDSGQYQDIARFDDVTFTEEKSDAKEFDLDMIKGSILVHKVDQDGKGLANAEFTRTDKNGETEVKMTDQDGVVEFNIEANNSYSVEETKNPENYTGTFREENITLEKDGQVFEYTVENQLNPKVEKPEVETPKPENPKPLPQTGESKLITGVIGAILITAGCVGFVIWKKKKANQ